MYAVVLSVFFVLICFIKLIEIFLEVTAIQGVFCIVLVVK